MVSDVLVDIISGISLGILAGLFPAVVAFETVVVNLSIFVFGGFSAAVGWRAGDRLGRHERFTAASFQPSLSPLVRATGRVITVEQLQAALTFRLRPLGGGRTAPAGTDRPAGPNAEPVPSGRRPHPVPGSRRGGPGHRSDGVAVDVDDFVIDIDGNPV